MSAIATELKVRKLHSDFVIEIDERIDQLLDDADAIEQVRQLWQTSPLIVFPRQCLEEADQVKFTSLLGKCETANRKDIQSPYHEEIIYFSTLRYADGRFVGGFAGGDDVDWHSDQTFIARPATGAILYGVEVRDTRAGSRIGARLIQPLDRAGAAPILIDRGWAPTDRASPPAPATPVTVDGYIRTADRAGWFSAADDLAGRRFYTLDPAKMAGALGMADAVPFVLVALGTVDGNSLPQPAVALPRPPNDHFVYALTWFSLAGILVIIFSIHARKVLRA